MTGGLATSAVSALAIAGGRRTREAAFAPWPSFEADEIEAAVEVLKSGKINYRTGEQGRLFEEEFAPLAGCKHAAAVANGTVALELALYALGIGAGNEVIARRRMGLLIRDGRWGRWEMRRRFRFARTKL